MTAVLQTLAALVVVAGAALYGARRAGRSWRAARQAGGCGAGCDCH
jgi:hypothetical protein